MKITKLVFLFILYSTFTCAQNNSLLFRNNSAEIIIENTNIVIQIDSLNNGEDGTLLTVAITNRSNNAILFPLSGSSFYEKDKFVKQYTFKTSNIHQQANRYVIIPKNAIWTDSIIIEKKHLEYAVTFQFFNKYNGKEVLGLTEPMVMYFSQNYPLQKRMITCYFKSNFSCSDSNKPELTFSYEME